MNELSPIDKPAVLSDESHAVAIIKNWMRATETARCKAKNLLRDLNIEIKGKKHNINKIIIPYLDSIDSIVISRSDKQIECKKNTSILTNPISYTFLQSTYRLQVGRGDKDRLLVPIVTEYIQTKSLKHTPYVVCYLTEHFLARVLMRTNSNIFEDIKLYLATLIEKVHEIYRGEVGVNRDLVIVSDDGIVFIDTELVNGSYSFVIKTYISKGRLYGGTAKAFNNIIDAKQGEETFILSTKEHFASMKVSVR
tara:strand:+ start:7957 stop:8712 length:756 start_codon:yes stop_codon:yes gene_type:complete